MTLSPFALVWPVVRAFAEEQATRARMATRRAAFVRRACIGAIRIPGRERVSGGRSAEVSDPKTDRGTFGAATRLPHTRSVVYSVPRSVKGWSQATRSVSGGLR